MIIREMQQNGSPEPVFDFDDERTWFSVMLPIHPDFKIVKEEDQKGNQIAQTGYQVGDQITSQGDQINQRTVTITEKQMEIYELISASPNITRAQLSEKLKISDSIVKKRIDALRIKGVLERVGGTRGHWKIVNKNVG